MFTSIKKLGSFLTILSLISCESQEGALESIEFENPYKFRSQLKNEVERDTTSWKMEISAQSYAMNADYQNALKLYDVAKNSSENKGLTKTEIDSMNSIYRTKNAIDYITEKSKSRRVVIINEAHHNSMHRVFTKSLLNELFEIGYKNIGLEALSNGEYLDSMLMDRKYPIIDTGYYIKDPQFGNLVREAIEIGFHVFPYEDINHNNGKQREIEQAKNIQKEMDKRPDEKFLIHCGFGHVTEGNHESLGKTMAGRLAEFMKIDPLTIDQIEYSEKSRLEFNNPLLNALKIDEPSILIDKNGKPFKYKRDERWADIAVFHPKTEFIDSRPNWLFEKGNGSVQIELDDIDISYPIMVLAYKKDENIVDAVPMDLIEIADKSDKRNLALSKGEYEIVVTNIKGNARKFDLYVE